MNGLNRLLDVTFVLLWGLQETFRRAPAPANAPLVSGTAPVGHGETKPLSQDQLVKIDTWLRMNHSGWRRHFTPPARSTYMVQLEHLDGTTTFLHLFSRAAPAIYFSKHGENKMFDAGWLFCPIDEVDDLIKMLRS